MVGSIVEDSSGGYELGLAADSSRPNGVAQQLPSSDMDLLAPLVADFEALSVMAQSVGRPMLSPLGFSSKAFVVPSP